MINVNRQETLTEHVGTIIQSGHRDRKTSHEIAAEVVAFIDRYEASLASLSALEQRELARLQAEDGHRSAMETAGF